MFSELSKTDVWLCVFAVEWNFATYSQVASAVEAWRQERSRPLLDHLCRAGGLTEESRKALDDLLNHRSTTLVLPKRGKTTLRDARRVNELKQWSASQEHRSLDDTVVAK